MGKGTIQYITTCRRHDNTSWIFYSPQHVLGLPHDILLHIYTGIIIYKSFSVYCIP